ncbi:MAG: hypothetical protein AMXMBFR84_46130 [Candidatus Hydrogenedentota bacterium]
MRTPPLICRKPTDRECLNDQYNGAPIPRYFKLSPSLKLGSETLAFCFDSLDIYQNLDYVK